MVSKDIRVRGAGVLIIDADQHELLLIRDYDGTYNDCGGSRDQGESIESTASRELKEETRGIFYVSPWFLSNCTYIMADQYRCYLLVLTGKQLKNAQMLYDSADVDSYSETTGLERFPVGQFGKDIDSRAATDKRMYVRLNDRIMAVLSQIKNNMKTSSSTQT
jgi:hypothetical protein